MEELIFLIKCNLDNGKVLLCVKSSLSITRLLCVQSSFKNLVCFGLCLTTSNKLMLILLKSKPIWIRRRRWIRWKVFKKRRVRRY